MHGSHLRQLALGIQEDRVSRTEVSFRTQCDMGNRHFLCFCLWGIAGYL